VKISILERGVPEIIGSTGVSADLSKLTLNEGQLLRMLILAKGAELSREVLATVVGPEEVHRAIMHLRRALAGCRPSEQEVVGTDQSIIRTARREHAAYSFVLDRDDELDLDVVNRKLTEANLALAKRQADDVLLSDLSWLDALESTDLDHAFEDTDQHVWTAEDRRGIEVLRARGWAVRARVASRDGRHHDVNELVAKFIDVDEVFDANVAECAVKAHFVVNATREAGINAIQDYFDDRGLTYTTEIDTFSYALNDAEGDGYATFVATWIARWDNAPTVGPRTVDSTEPPAPTLPYTGATLSRPGVPDILTPGLTLSQLEAELSQRYEPEMVDRLVNISKAAVASVERGDFVAQEAIGRSLLELAETESELASTGQYFLAEGLRLQADLTTGAPRQTLLRLALDAYGASRDLDPENIRAIRGSARTYEVLGDHQEAATNFRLAYQLGRQQLAASEQLAPSARLGLSHEALRAGRHYVHCLQEILTADPVSARLLEASPDAIINLARESSGMHRERMPLFRSNQDWSRVEWFMGLTLLAKSYAGVGDSKTALGELANAITARRPMLAKGRPLTVIERANLRWWAATAAAVRKEHVVGWNSGLAELQGALAGADDEAILSAVDALLATLRPILPPQF
jgi:hypothetical protein